MKFLGYQASDGEAMIGIVDAAGESVRALTTIDDFYVDPTHALAQPASGDPLPIAGLTQVPPVPVTSRVLCLGQNYQAHIDEISEVGRKRPEFPNVFARWASTLCPPDSATPVPAGDIGLDWEAELAFIVAKPMVEVAEADALDGILGYTCFNDVSARKLQKATNQWTLGKNGDNSGPIGPWVVTPDEVGDVTNLRVTSRVNGETKQDGNTADMIFKIPETLVYITRAMTLRPGDVIATGTPDGVGLGQTPPVFMHAGDSVEVEIENIGTLRSSIS